MDFFVDIFVGFIFYCVFAPFVAYGLLRVVSSAFRAQRSFAQVVIAAVLGWVTLPLGLSVAGALMSRLR
jgi:hypothetical protein